MQIQKSSCLLGMSLQPGLCSDIMCKVKSHPVRQAQSIPQVLSLLASQGMELQLMHLHSLNGRGSDLGARFRRYTSGNMPGWGGSKRPCDCISTFAAKHRNRSLFTTVRWLTSSTCVISHNKCAGLYRMLWRNTCTNNESRNH